MHEAVKEKTSFITKDVTYCYRAMPFRLKNAGATYQRLMNKIFKEQIGRNAKVYVNDIIIKSRSFEEHVKNLKEIFTVLERLLKLSKYPHPTYRQRRPIYIFGSLQLGN